MDNIMDGKKYRDELLEEYKNIIEKEKLDITLAIIQVGNNDASNVYVRNKIKYSKMVGINAELYNLEETTSEEELLSLIEKLNNDEKVTGIILQSPVPKGIDFEKCAGSILPNKDIDGFTDANTARLYHNKECLMPCTVKGIVKLLEHYNVNLEGMNAVIVGRGDIVGKPLSLLLTNKNATVTLCHSKTKNLGEITKNADIIISATGQAKLIKEDMVRSGFIGVDVGINRDNGVLCGDFDFDNICSKAKLITPVPGGVGPMTIAMIIDNLIEAKKGSK